MDEVVSKALKKKRELLLEIEKIDQFIRTYEDLTGTKIQRDEMVSLPDQKPKKPTRKKIVTLKPSLLRMADAPKRIAQAAESVIQEAGMPVMRGDIVARIEAKGVSIKSADKARYVGTILWRERAKFQNIEGRGYWLRSLGEPPALSDEELFP